MMCSESSYVIVNSTFFHRFTQRQNNTQILQKPMSVWFMSVNTCSVCVYGCVFISVAQSVKIKSVKMQCVGDKEKTQKPTYIGESIYGKPSHSYTRTHTKTEAWLS